MDGSVGGGDDAGVVKQAMVGQKASVSIAKELLRSCGSENEARMKRVERTETKRSRTHRRIQSADAGKRPGLGGGGTPGEQAVSVRTSLRSLEEFHCFEE